MMKKTTKRRPISKPLNSAAIRAFEEREDLKQFGANALLLFALQLRRQIEDIQAIAVDALTDGPGDKKCDLVYIDRDGRRVLVAQGYVSTKSRKEAPSNKASDLNTAAAWLLTTSEKQLPPGLRQSALEVREALNNNEIDVFEFWYVHNCPESTNVSRELTTTKQAVRRILDGAYGGSGCKEVRATEVGLGTLEEWYRSIRTPILVSEKVSVDTPGGYELKSTDWSSHTTAVPAAWLHELYQEHETDLFSANVRDYLGSLKKDSNVNFGIKESARNSPANFWAFNNGITAIVNDFRAKGNRLTLHGLSIVNGAQTTGAIGSLSNPPDKNALIPARFIKCESETIIQDIVRFNNSQNRVAPADFRSTDSVQERLRAEFLQRLPRLRYSGGRRGGASDAIGRPTNQLYSDTVAQSLTAFHQNPVLAYSRKGDIWESDAHYSQIFNELTHAEHILFVYGLYQGISGLKLETARKVSGGGSVTAAERDLANFFALRGSVHLAVAAIGACMESLLERPVPSLFDLRFGNGVKQIGDATLAWKPIVSSCMALHNCLRSALEGPLRTSADTTAQIAQFRSLIEATRVANRVAYGHFAKLVTTEPWASESKRNSKAG